MSFPMYSINMDFNQCYPYFNELYKCQRENLFGKTVCASQRDDFNECVHKDKYNKLMAETQQELRKAKVINVPTYDPINDRFVFDDGKIVSNQDPIFKRFKWL